MRANSKFQVALDRHETLNFKLFAAQSINSI